MAQRRRLEVFRSAAGSVLSRALTVTLLCAIASPALAQRSRAFELGGRYLISMVQGDGAFPGGTLDIDSSQGFEACAELFLSDRYSARLSATFLQPTAILFPSAPPPNDVDLGTLGITPIALTGRMHFRHGARIEPYGGAGAAIVILGNLDDQFGDDVDVNLDRPVTFVVEGGVRYQLRSLPVALEAGVSYMPITGTLDVKKTNVALPDEVKIDPVFLSMGVNWRF